MGACQGGFLSRLLGMRNLLILLAIVFVGALGYGVYLGFQAQELKEIAGYAENDRGVVSDIPKLIEQVAKAQKDALITEREVNSWLATQLTARQEGVLADYADLKIKGVWVRFEEEEGGRAEIIIEREIYGRLQTVSMYVRIEREKVENGKFVNYIRRDGGRLWGVVPLGGRFGVARVPQGFIFFTHDSFKALEDLFAKEMLLLQDGVMGKEGGRISIEEKQLRISFQKS